MVIRRQRLAVGASAAVVALVTTGCLQARNDPSPTIANNTDQTVYFTFWRGSSSDPGFVSVREYSEGETFLARNDDTGCLTDGGWHTLKIYDRSPEPNSDGNGEREQLLADEELLADPAYVHDIDQQPLCGGETWTWDGEQLLRTD